MVVDHVKPSGHPIERQVTTCLLCLRSRATVDLVLINKNRYQGTDEIFETCPSLSSTALHPWFVHQHRGRLV